MPQNKPLLLFLILFLTLAGCAENSAAQPNAGLSPTPLAERFAVVAEGRLLPRQFAQLSFASGGKVAEVLAAEGVTVSEGEVIARLESSESLAAEAARAELELLNARQALADLKESAASVKAQAGLAVAQAQESLEKAQRDLKSVENPAGQPLYDAVDDAKLALDTAQANVDLSRVGEEATAVKNAEDDMNLAYSRLQRAQVNYDDCLKISCGERVFIEDALNEAKKAYQRALDAYLTAKLRYETVVANQADDLEKAQRKHDAAVANLNAALGGPSETKTAIARAKVAVAEAALAEAQADYAKVAAGPDPAQLAIAEARVKAAEAALAAAKAAIENNELRAPFAGTLASLNVKAGDQVSPGQSVAALADFSGWIVETNNLTELEVVRVEVGQGVSVVFDALPDLALRGEVVFVSNVFQEQRGDITYTVRIALAEGHPQMLWGMTAQATFDK